MQQSIVVLLAILSDGQSQGIRRALMTSGQPPDPGPTDRALKTRQEVYPEDLKGKWYRALVKYSRVSPP
jgi:hypothetical protein